MPTNPESINSDDPATIRRRTDHARAKAGVDLVVIGGGVNGCAIAWDATLRGLRVLLLEKEDFGWATSAWNSRLIHGGLKYLEKYDVRLVRESLREREWLLRAAPHLVQPLQFALPMYERNAHPALMLRFGLTAYDVLSWDKSLPNHRTIDTAAALEMVPGLDDDGLQGAGLYYDGQIEYAERLSVELALAAQAAGAIVINHAQVSTVALADGSVEAVEYVDTISGRRHRVKTTYVVNAAGPWVDEVAETVWSATDSMMGGTKGTHLVVDRFEGGPVETAMYYEAITDARPMLVIPWLGKYLIGATDVRFDGDLDRATADDDELDYILTETNRIFPDAKLTRASVHWSYTGVRPLPYQADGPTGDITRRHIVHDHAKDSARPAGGMYSIIGGKLTTCRALAEHVVNDLLGRGGLLRGRRSPTWWSRLPGGALGEPSALADDVAATGLVDIEQAQRLVRLYGGRTAGVLALIEADGQLAEAIPNSAGALRAEVIWAIREELAVTLGDIVARRMMTGIGPDLGIESLSAVAEVAAVELSWSPEQVESQLAEYRSYITKFNPRSQRAEA